jgi:hypothetical protein
VSGRAASAPYGRFPLRLATRISAPISAGFRARAAPSMAEHRRARPLARRPTSTAQHPPRPHHRARGGAAGATAVAAAPRPRRRAHLLAAPRRRPAKHAARTRAATPVLTGGHHTPTSALHPRSPYPHASARAPRSPRPTRRPRPCPHARAPARTSTRPPTRPRPS